MRVAVEVDLRDVVFSLCHTARTYGGDRLGRMRPQQ